MSRKTSAPKARRDGWLEFDGRTFLTEVEHETYRRRLPVRYPAKNLKTPADTCAKCGKPASVKNPIQVAHKIPFAIGVIRFWLTPEWLDGPHNLIRAHKQECNKGCEIPFDRIPEYLKREFHIEIPKHLCSSGRPTDRF